VPNDDKFCEFILSCGSWQEAQKIADSLLDKKLVACVEFIESQSKYIWHGQKEEAKEVTLLMESLSTLFSAVEEEVAKIHSYETFVLKEIPISRVSKKAQDWWNASVKE
jgi:periplasmic divalent cation tolerance protein